MGLSSAAARPRQPLPRARLTGRDDFPIFMAAAIVMRFTGIPRKYWSARCFRR